MEKENKYKKWVVTIFYKDKEFEGMDNSLIEVAFRDANIKKYVFQVEKAPTTGAIHVQACVELEDRKRHSTLLNSLHKTFCVPKTAVTLERMFGSFEESALYCSKAETRMEGFEPCFAQSIQPPYKGEDINFLKDKDKRYPWQNALSLLLFETDETRFKEPDDRTIHWITDIYGNSGKSALVKYYCFNYTGCTKVSFGSAAQLRSGVIDAGPNVIYFIDIPRTLGTDDSLNNTISVIEDLKNGFVVSNMHGKNRRLMIKPPHIVVFSNMKAPTEKLSSDRWELRFIGHNKELLKEY